MYWNKALFLIQGYPYQENKKESLCAGCLQRKLHTCEEFLEPDNILVSDHIRLISSLLERISAEWPDEIPEQYKR
jgi:hypothetical protein